ncbi:AraC family transcriptional regulator [Vibrio fluvialis]|nr:AraC family transcriptional regulator [Vibrio fluvialis]
MNHQYQITVFRAGQQQPLRNVRIHSPSLIQITAGSKRLFWQDETSELGATQILLCSSGMSLSFENMPHKGRFSSRMFSFFCTPPPAMLELSLRNAEQGTSFMLFHDAALRDTLNALYAFDRQTLSAETQQYWVLGLYQQLAERGVLHHLFATSQDSLTQKLSRYLSHSPSHDHLLDDVARHFAMSRATMIRKLRQEGVQYREVLAEVRLNHALRLMQEGHSNVALIASLCGYQSEGRFSQRFKDKFGISPKGYVKTLDGNETSAVTSRLQ